MSVAAMTAADVGAGGEIGEATAVEVAAVAEEGEATILTTIATTTPEEGENADFCFYITPISFTISAFTNLKKKIKKFKASNTDFSKTHLPLHQNRQLIACLIHTRTISHRALR